MATVNCEAQDRRPDLRDGSSGDWDCTVTEGAFDETFGLVRLELFILDDAVEFNRSLSPYERPPFVVNFPSRRY